MTRVKYEQLRDGDVASTVEVRTDLLFDVDDQGHVLGVERIGDDVRATDLADVIRALVYVKPPTEEPEPTCTDCGVVDYYLTLIVIEVNDGEEMGGRDEFEVCNDCLLARASALVAAGSTAELVTGAAPSGDES